MKQRNTVITALLLLLTMQGSMLTACGNAEIPADTDAPDTNVTVVSETEAETEPVVERLYDNLGDADFGGYDFRVLSCVFVGRELANFLIADTLTGDKVNDAVYNSTKAVEDRFNMNFSIVNVADTSAVTNTVKRAVKAGDDVCDIQCGHDGNTAGLGKQGYLYDLFNVKQFDFSRPWWPENIVKQLSIGGKLFIGSNYLTYNGLHWTRILIANKKEMENHDYDIPYQQILDGNWYLDDLYKMVQGCGKDLNGDGKMGKEDFYGFIMGCGVTYCMQDTFGISFYDKSGDGLTVSFDSERVSTFINKWKQFKDNEQDCIYGATTDNEFSQLMFRNGQVLFGTTMVGTAYDDFRDLDFPFSILPFPKLDEQQKDYINTCTDAFWAIPTTSYEHLDIIGTVVEALSCANYQDVLPVYFETALKVKLSESPDDAAMFDIIRDTRTIGFEYAFQMTFSDIYNTFVNGKSEFASYVEKNREKAQKNADKLLAAIEEIE